MSLIFKLLSRAEWQGAQVRGRFDGSAVDHADGYIHFSDADQLQETARRYFHGHDDLMLLAVETDGLEATLRWEPSRGGALFPHLYAPLPLAAVVWSRPVDLGPDGAPVIGALLP